jgi:hemolysin-activating ACP:hemolysin acyltransferase
MNAMLIHGHLPSTFMETVILPVIKNKRGDITNKDNYRPIAITNIF